MSGPDELPPAGVLPEEAIAFFRAKGFRIGFAWEDVWKGEHSRWFTVAKAMSRDVLEDIRAAVDTAIADGTTLADFKKTLRPTLQAKGWWGQRQMLDPATGQRELVQLGSDRRLETIFDTNLRTAYSAGKWERFQRTKAALPFVEYSALMDGRERPQHHAWNGTILHIDDPWWDTHWPPCDWRCRCSPVQRSQRMLDRQGKSVTTEPVTFRQVPWTNKRTGETGMRELGVGKGWDYNVGKEYLRGLAPGPLPESFGNDEEIGAAAELGGAKQVLVDRFLKSFGIAPGKEAIWTDREGWPLSIGRGWFIGENGAVRVPPAGTIAPIAAAIVTPDRISWIWVRAQDGRVVLMRRYVRQAAGMFTVVDIGGVGWRWSITATLTGKDGEIAAGYDPRQPRDRNGRFASHQGGIASFLGGLGSGTGPHSIEIGRISAGAARKLEEFGHPGRYKDRPLSVHLERSRVTHILARHGADRPPQKPIGHADLAKAHRIFNAGAFEHGRPRVAPGGGRRVLARATIDGDHYTALFEVGRKRLVLHTMRKR